MLSRLALAAVCISAAFAADTRFEISYAASAKSGPGFISGRAFIMISRDVQREPRLEIGRVGVPFFGRDFEKLAPGQSAIIDATDLGTPVESLAQIASGDYYVQAFINVYSGFSWMREFDGNCAKRDDARFAAAGYGDARRWYARLLRRRALIHRRHSAPRSIPVAFAATRPCRGGRVDTRAHGCWRPWAG